MHPISPWAIYLPFDLSLAYRLVPGDVVAGGGAKPMIVVKIGSNVLTALDGSLDRAAMEAIVMQIVELKVQQVPVIVVSSGAVASGRQLLQPASKTVSRVERRQFWAALGQPALIHAYSGFFSQYGIHVAQILATKEDFRDRRHYLHMRNCFRALLDEYVVPIVNENDVIAIDELMFTDNDELASLVASMVGAGALYILTNVDGIYTGEPGQPGSELVKSIAPDDDVAVHFRANKASSFGRGGILTKYKMSRKLAATGIDVYIANGKKPDTITAIFRGENPGTHICRTHQISSVKKWLAYQEHAVPGYVVINEGAARALCSSDRAASLLPIGILSVHGQFEKGDIVQIRDDKGRPIGLGKSSYNGQTLQKYLGLASQKAFIHYDYLVIHGNHNKANDGE